MPNKLKIPQSATPIIMQTRDLFQTPNYATDLIVPYINHEWLIWEACVGQEKIARRLREHNFTVLGTDIQDGPEYNCLTFEPEWTVWDCMITNPPFSLKRQIAKRFIELDKPFALLIPADWSIWLIEAVEKSGCRLLIPNRRINYITPDILQHISDQETYKIVKKQLGLENSYRQMRFDPQVIELMAVHRIAVYPTLDDVPPSLMAKYSSSQFHSMWLTRYLPLPEVVTFTKLTSEQMLVI
jgi:hypothetical protein